jgi:hypothetical protein
MRMQMKGWKKMKTATFNRFNFEMPVEAVEDCYHVGACDAGTEYWQPRIDLSHISDEQLALELNGYGAWTVEELSDRRENERRIIWIAAADIQDEEKE